jgi:hypothetical protein
MPVVSLSENLIFILIRGHSLNTYLPSVLKDIPPSSANALPISFLFMPGVNWAAKDNARAAEEQHELSSASNLDRHEQLGTIRLSSVTQNNPFRRFFSVIGLI